MNIRKVRIMKTGALILILAGCAIFSVSLGLPAPDFSSLTESDSATLSKYTLEDYAGTFVIVGITLLLLFRRGTKNFRTPKSLFKIGFIGLGGAVAGALGSYAEEMIFEARYPAELWNTTPGGIIIVEDLFVLLLIFLINLPGLNKNCKCGVGIGRIDASKMNYWYLAMLILSGLMYALLLIGGNFMLLISCGLFVVFFASLFLGRSEAAKL